MEITCAVGDRYVVELSDIWATLVDIDTGDVWYHVTGAIFVQDGYWDCSPKYDKQTVDKIKAAVEKAEKLRAPIYKINKKYKRKFGYSADIGETTNMKVTAEEVDYAVKKIQDCIKYNYPMEKPMDIIKYRQESGFLRHEPPKLTWSFAVFEDLYKDAKK